MGHEGLQLAQYYVYYPLALLILGFGVFTAVRAGQGFSRLGRFVTIAGLALLVAKTLVYRPANHDFGIFLEAGERLLAGADPYADVRVANPPTATPLFAAFAGLPRDAGPAIWTGLNLLLGVLLVPLACAALAGRKGEPGLELPAAAVWALAAVVSVSIALHFQIDLGQLTALESACILAALACRARDWPILAGVFLGAATIKPHSMLPFLLLFLRRKDLQTWAAMAVTAGVLCLGAGSLSELPERIQTDLHNIAAMAAPGGTNDYSFEGPFGHTIVGLDRAFYCLGLRDRETIRVLQLALLAAGALWLVSLAGRPNACPPGAVPALVALYSVVFLYHRTYDTLILALPVVYSAWRLRVGAQSERRWSLAALAAQLLVLFTHPKLVELVVTKLCAGQPTLQRIGQGVALPYATWLTLVAMICLTCGASASQREVVRFHREEAVSHDSGEVQPAGNLRIWRRWGRLLRLR